MLKAKNVPVSSNEIIYALSMNLNLNIYKQVLIVVLEKLNESFFPRLLVI